MSNGRLKLIFAFLPVMVFNSRPSLPRTMTAIGENSQVLPSSRRTWSR